MTAKQARAEVGRGRGKCEAGSGAGTHERSGMLRALTGDTNAYRDESRRAEWGVVYAVWRVWMESARA
jgi:hypothetical protein